MDVKYVGLKENIKSIRYELGSTQEDFATCLGVSVITVKQWEKGLYLPSAKSYNAICELLNANMLTNYATQLKEYIISNKIK